VAKKNILTQGKKAKAEQFARNNSLTEAESLYASVCKTDPMDVESWAKLAAIRQRLGQHVEAEACARRALLLDPALIFALRTLAATLQSQGKLDQAAKTLETALTRHPASAELMVSLARLREQQGKINEAYTLYHRALDTQPETSYVLAKRAELLEKTGQLVEAEIILEKGMANDPVNPVLNLVAARLDRRAGRDEEAAKKLDNMIGRSMDPDTSAEIHLLLGQTYDRLGYPAKAMPHIREGKQLRAQVSDPEGRGRARFLAKVDAASAWTAPHPDVSEAALPEACPTFLIGFPRSGTTLLEQILDSHPAIQTLEEKPISDVLENAFLDMTGGGADALERLSDDQLGQLRARYWAEVDHLIERQPGALVVDKLPLNIVRAPLLWRIFPQARFILAIRHPCDVTLSCMMQNFGHNDAMAGFTSLESIAEIYTRVMGTWLDHVQRFPLNFHRIRYEDLITHFTTEAHALLDFLGVGWDEAVLDHTRHAQERSIINTPSYHQVTQPIYQHAKYRWKRYETDFVPVMATLWPYIEHFGYREAEKNGAMASEPA
jgi:tetratricopeptide (TPR) repeat protein